MILVQSNPSCVFRSFALYSYFLLQEVGFKDDNVLYIALCSSHLMRGERDAPGQVLQLCKLFISICKGRDGVKVEEGLKNDSVLHIAYKCSDNLMYGE